MTVPLRIPLKKIVISLTCLLMLPLFVYGITTAFITPQEDSPADLPLGQMLLVGFSGSVIDEGHPILEDIQQHHLGGVILFNYGPADGAPASNITSPHQLRKLTTRLQQAAPEKVPLLIAVDQEGGRICRLKKAMVFHLLYLSPRWACVTT